MCIRDRYLQRANSKLCFLLHDSRFAAENSLPARGRKHVAVAVPVVALAQSACNSGSCTKGDKDMAEACLLYTSDVYKRQGVIMVADSLKPDSRAAVDYLKRMNLRVVMLTGDNAATARHMACLLYTSPRPRKGDGCPCRPQSSG